MQYVLLEVLEGLENIFIVLWESLLSVKSKIVTLVYAAAILALTEVVSLNNTLKPTAKSVYNEIPLDNEKILDGKKIRNAAHSQ